jgi:hypothetical protein
MRQPNPIIFFFSLFFLRVDPIHFGPCPRKPACSHIYLFSVFPGSNSQQQQAHCSFPAHPTHSLSQPSEPCSPFATHSTVIHFLRKLMPPPPPDRSVVRHHVMFYRLASYATEPSRSLSTSSLKNGPHTTAALRFPFRVETITMKIHRRRSPPSSARLSLPSPYKRCPRASPPHPTSILDLSSDVPCFEAL